MQLVFSSIGSLIKYGFLVILGSLMRIGVLSSIGSLT